MGRTYIRIYCDKWLEGTLRDESLELRGAWSDLLALCGSGKYNATGEIKLTNNLGLTNDQIAGILHTSPNTWATIKQRLVETERISCDPETNIIKILNWNVYQPAWDKKAYMRLYMQQRRERESEGLSPAVTQPESLSDHDEALFTILERLPTWPRNRNAAKLQELLTDYPSLNYDLEFKKFAEWWSKRKLKVPWLALRNWLEKASKATEAKAEEQVEKRWQEKQEKALQQESSAD